MLDGVENERAPAQRELATRRRDADEEGVRPPSEAFAQGCDDRYGSAEAENVLGDLAGARRIDDGDNVIRRVANTRIGGLRPKGTERTFGENEKTRIHWWQLGRALDRRVLGDGDDIDWRAFRHQDAAAGRGKAEYDGPFPGRATEALSLVDTSKQNALDDD